MTLSDSALDATGYASTLMRSRCWTATESSMNAEAPVGDPLDMLTSTGAPSVSAVSVSAGWASLIALTSLPKFSIWALVIVNPACAVGSQSRSTPSRPYWLTKLLMLLANGVHAAGVLTSASMQ